MVGPGCVIRCKFNPASKAPSEQALKLLPIPLQNLKMTTIGSDSDGEAGRILEEFLKQDSFPPDFKECILREQLIRSGDADTILEVIEEDYFPSDFMEYMLMEQLKWSRSCVWSPYDYGWVFWSQQDHEIEPSHSLGKPPSHFLSGRDNIRLALHKLIESTWLPLSLVQFWAATTTLEGRTKLTTQYQPFALAPTFDLTERQRLCEYRVKMCKDYNFFYADAESGEQQLGLPGRVFLHQFPESSPDVEYYSTKEYPQRDLALRCKIKGSWTVPVFEHSSQTCVGVLEMVYLYGVPRNWLDESFLRNMHDIFQGLGLQYFDGLHACVEEGKGVKVLPHAFKELNMVLRSVCEIHVLLLAMTWVPCSACNSLRQCEVFSADVLRGDIYLDFLKAGKRSHLRKGLVAGRAHSSPNMLYCSDITRLSLDEYPLVPYARMCNLSSWFTICLQCKHTGNYIYVEFFLSPKTRSAYDGNILTILGFILGTIEKKFTTFRLASGKELGESMSVEVIYFQNDQKIHSIQTIQATSNFSMSSILSSVQSSASVANRRHGFQDANMGTIKAKYDLNSDPFSDSDSYPSFEQSSTSVANTRPGVQDANMVTIKAKYASFTIVFKLSLPCRFVELQQEVAKRLMQAGTYHVVYENEEDGFVLIACDEDLQAHVDASMSQGNTSTMVLLQPKEPAWKLLAVADISSYRK